MHPKARNILVVLILVAIVTRWLQYVLDLPDISTYLYFLLILLGIFQGIRVGYQFQEKEKFSDLLKSGLQIAAFLSVAIALFSFFFYSQIDVTYFDDQLAERVKEAKELGYSEEDIAKLKTGFSKVFTPATYSTFILFGLLIMSVLYGVVTTFLYRKIQVFRTI